MKEYKTQLSICMEQGSSQKSIKKYCLFHIVPNKADVFSDSKLKHLLSVHQSTHMASLQQNINLLLYIIS